MLTASFNLLSMKLRLLQSLDIPLALELSDEVGWNQTSTDWRMLLDLAPETCFCLELDGCLAATTTILSHNPSSAWLGMVLTRRDYQRHGFASRLVAHALATADRLGIETLGLDATDQGQPIYERAGFVAWSPIERWMADGVMLKTRPQLSSGPRQSNWIDEIASLDRKAFGADRAGLLCALANNGWSPEIQTGLGYALTRPGSRANYVGPCVARTAEIAGTLIARSLRQHLGPWIWDLFPGNAASMELALEFGFKPTRRLVRMYRGQSPAGDPRLIHAIAGFELG
jgi:GNAT superfamily N-acetyltransferase